MEDTGLQAIHSLEGTDAANWHSTQVGQRSTALTLEQYMEQLLLQQQLIWLCSSQDLLCAER